MKKGFMFFLISIVITVSMMMVFTTQASTNNSDGLYATLSFEKNEYASNEDIVANLAVRNSNPFEVSGIKADLILPDNYDLVSGSEIQNLFTLGASESKNFSFAINEKASSNPETGDTGLGVYVVVILACVTGLIFISLRRKDKQIKNFVALVLCFALISSVIIPMATNAADAGSDITLTESVQVNGKEVSVTVVISYGDTESPALPYPTVEPGKETYAGSIDPSKGTTYNFESSDGTQNNRMDSSTLAVQFFATTTFNTFTKTWYSTSGKILFRLYRWLGTYEDSVYGENVQLVVEKQFDCAPTGARIVFTFDEQVDGEYILVATPGDDAGEHTIGYAGKTGATQFHTNVYVNDEYAEGVAISLLLTYTKTPENLYGPISQKQTATPEPTATQAPTAEPTPEATPESPALPYPTVEPGKETYAGSIDPSKGTNYNFESSDGTQNNRMNSSTLAVQFFATTTFNTFTKTWYSTSGKILFRLYRWLGTYEDSVYGENVQLVVEKQFDCAPTGARIVFTFDEQVDGEYILVATPGDDAGEHTIGYAGTTGATQFHTNVYVNDEYAEGVAISLLLTYTKTPENLYGPVSEAK